MRRRVASCKRLRRTPSPNLARARRVTGSCPAASPALAGVTSGSCPIGQLIARSASEVSARRGEAEESGQNPTLGLVPVRERRKRAGERTSIMRIEQARRQSERQRSVPSRLIDDIPGDRGLLRLLKIRDLGSTAFLCPHEKRGDLSIH